MASRRLLQERRQERLVPGVPGAPERQEPITATTWEPHLQVAAKPSREVEEGTRR